MNNMIVIWFGVSNKLERSKRTLVDRSKETGVFSGACSSSGNSTGRTVVE